MKITIQYKLFMSMLAATVLVIGYMGVVTQWSFDKGFLEYIDTQEQVELELVATELEAYYAKHQSWESLKQDKYELFSIFAKTLPEGRKKRYLQKKIRNKELPAWMNDKEPPNDKKHPTHPLERTIILDEFGLLFFGSQRGDALPNLRMLTFEKQEIGAIGLYPPEFFQDSHQLLFVKKQKLIIVLVALAAILISIGLSLPLAFQLTKPVRRLSAAARRLIGGDYSTRVQVTSNDELGALSRDFNTLAETLGKTETQRKQWISDIAHELRTPLTSLQGEIEAVQDGIRQPDQQTFSNLHQGVSRLNRLVEDLYDLSLSELGVLSFYQEQIDFRALLADEVTARQNDAEKAKLRLLLDTEQKPLIISGDKQRLQQLFNNLLSNSITYTEQGGAIEISLHRDNSNMKLDIMDTAPGVPDEALPQLFNRLFRVEQSRNRSLGGAGLGLAICQQIVTAHNGTITATHSPTGGLWVQVTLPLLGESS
ncbi:ATP-binding protein [Desulfogranum marinum]|jgi:two-component system sensor histidine kinase BaeS|uniref:ATP-binding protein n=1 Tax=Desulfogranum marinum TaxID=453220 RepID=UPI0029C6006F|nr:ATP-binding protein [Desulfogranum marinum]